MEKLYLCVPVCECVFSSGLEIHTTVVPVYNTLLAAVKLEAWLPASLQHENVCSLHWNKHLTSFVTVPTQER